MLDKQSKNIIKILVVYLVALVVGEGVLSLGIYWPLLFMTVERKFAYWLAFFVGVVVAVIYSLPIGWTSLFVVLVVGGVSFLANYRSESSWIYLLLSMIINFVFDRIFGLNWGWWEILATVVMWLTVVRGFDGSESIKINY